MFCEECVKKIPDGSKFCDECGASEEEHKNSNCSDIIGKFRKIVYLILGILEVVFSTLDSANVGNGPYKELLSAVRAAKKAFGFED